MPNLCQYAVALDGKNQPSYVRVVAFGFAKSNFHFTVMSLPVSLRRSEDVIDRHFEFGVVCWKVATRHPDNPTAR